MHKHGMMHDKISMQHINSKETLASILNRPHSNLIAYEQLPICYVRYLMMWQVIIVKVRLICMGMQETSKGCDNLSFDMLNTNFGNKMN